jgi:hypothetical protein
LAGAEATRVRQPTDYVFLKGSVGVESFQKGISSEKSVGDRGASASRLDEKPPELLAGGLKQSLLIFAAVTEEQSAVFDHLEKDLIHGSLSKRKVVVEISE